MHLIRCKFLVLAALLFCPFVAKAQTEVCPPAAPTISAQVATERIKSAKDKGFLYSFTKDGQVSWLYGTIHVGNEDVLFPGPQLLSTLKQAKAVALELDMSNPAEFLKVLQVAANTPANQQLRTAGRMQAIARAAKEACVSDLSLSPLPVTMQVMTFMLNEFKRFGLFFEMSQEQFLVGFAGATGKKIHALETMQEQLVAFEGDTIEDSGRLVDAMLHGLKSPHSNKAITELVNLWRDVDEQKLHAYFSWCNCVNTDTEKRFMSKLLAGRNPTMLERALKLHDQYRGGVLVAVGSLHLIGETGLLQGLRSAGYTINKLY